MDKTVTLSLYTLFNASAAVCSNMTSHLRRKNNPGDVITSPGHSDYGTYPKPKPQLLHISKYNHKTSVFTGKCGKALLLGENKIYLH